MARIELHDVTKRWGGYYAVEHLDLVIEDNAFVTLLGPSGCGKTTTLRMIAGLETPTEGRITIDGVPMFDSELGINVPPNKRRVGFLFQNYALWPNMTVYQNIAFGLSNINESGAAVNEKGEVVRDESGKAPARKLTKEEIKRAVDRVSAIVKIGPFMDRYPSELSGGQQQRVAIARTLAPGPRVLFMDEPLSNLDAKLRLEMRSELQRLHLSTGSTFVYVTHDQMEAMTLATRICLIDNGRLQQYDEPLTVYNKPNNLFVADFVGNPAVNFIEASGKQEGDAVKLSFLDGVQGSFTPNGGLKIADWYAQDDKQQAEAKAKAEAAAKQPGYVEKTNKDLPFPYHIARVEEPETENRPAATREDFVLGVRPEFVHICEDGAITGEVFSAMPTGMETTLKIKVGNYLLTAVVFGGVVYKIGQQVRLNFSGDNIMLFSRQSGRRIVNGEMKL
ncbi:MAG: ABC transporter ATP-binding protein [Clostridia bacterium]|nr:ABC transporter ATP-binding protein [Clostridia bacterium]